MTEADEILAEARRQVEEEEARKKQAFTDPQNSADYILGLARDTVDRERAAVAQGQPVPAAKPLPVIEAPKPLTEAAKKTPAPPLPQIGAAPKSMAQLGGLTGAYVPRKSAAPAPKPKPEETKEEIKGDAAYMEYAGMAPAKKPQRTLDEVFKGAEIGPKDENVPIYELPEPSAAQKTPKLIGEAPKEEPAAPEKIPTRQPEIFLYLVRGKQGFDLSPQEQEMLNSLSPAELSEVKQQREDIVFTEELDRKVYDYRRPLKAAVPTDEASWLNIFPKTMDLAGKAASGFATFGLSAATGGVEAAVGSMDALASGSDEGMANQLIFQLPEDRKKVVQEKVRAAELDPNYSSAQLLEIVLQEYSPEQREELLKKREEIVNKAKAIVPSYLASAIDQPYQLAAVGQKVGAGGIEAFDLLNETMPWGSREKSFQNFRARSLFNGARMWYENKNPTPYHRYLDAVAPLISSLAQQDIGTVEDYMEDFGMTKEQAEKQRNLDIEARKQGASEYLEEQKQSLWELNPNITATGDLFLPQAMAMGPFGYGSALVSAGRQLTPKLVRAMQTAGLTDKQLAVLQRAERMAQSKKARAALEAKQKVSKTEKAAAYIDKKISDAEAAYQEIKFVKALQGVAPYAAGAGVGYLAAGDDQSLTGTIAGAIGGRMLRSAPGSLRAYLEAGRISAGGTVGRFETMSKLAREAAAAKAGAAGEATAAANIAKGSAAEKILQFGGRRADNIVNNAGELIKAGVEPTLVGIATGVVDSQDGDQMAQVIGEGLLWTAFGLGQNRVKNKLLGTSDPILESRRRAQQDVDILKFRQTLPVEDRATLDGKLTSWETAVRAQQQSAEAAKRKYQEKKAELDALDKEPAEAAPAGKADFKVIEFTGDDGKKYLRRDFGPETRAEKRSRLKEEMNDAAKAARANEIAAKRMRRAGVQTQNEYGRQFLATVSRFNELVNGGFGTGQNNVNLRILTTEQIRNHLLKKYPDAVRNPQIMASINEAATQTGFYDAPTAKEYKPGMAPQDGAKFQVRMDDLKPSVVINADEVVKRANSLGRTPIEEFAHEAGHLLGDIPEYRELTEPARRKLFRQDFKDAQGNVIATTDGVYSDADLTDMFVNRYLAGATPEFKASMMMRFSAEQPGTNKYGLDEARVAKYMQDEIMSDLAGGSISRLFGYSKSDIRRQVVQNALTFFKMGEFRNMVRTLRSGLAGYGTASRVTFSPEISAMADKALRELEDLQGQISSPIQGEAPPKITKLELSKAKNRGILERFGWMQPVVKREVVAVIEGPDGKVIGEPQIIKDLMVYEGEWNVSDTGIVSVGQTYGPLASEVTTAGLPVGSKITIRGRVATNPDGSPKWTGPLEARKLAKLRKKYINDALDTPDYGAPNRFDPTKKGGETYRGTLSDMQIEAIKNLPESIIPKRLKDYFLQINDMIRRGNGERMMIDYAPMMNDKGEYVAFSPKIYDLVPIGLMLSKDGNLLATTISVGRMFGKLDAWAERMPLRLQFWQGSKQAFWTEFTQAYLDNWTKGLPGSGYTDAGTIATKVDADGNTIKATVLDADPKVAAQKRNIFDDFLNLFDKETEGFNPDRTRTPRRKGDPKGLDFDRTIMSVRIDHIAELAESGFDPLPISYDLAKKNFLPRREIEAEIARQFLPKRELTLDERVFPGFMSQLEDVLQQKIQGQSAPADQIKAIISNPQSGIKPSEIRWSRVMEGIDVLGKGGKNVNKADLMEYLRQNSTKFAISTLGSLGSNVSWKSIDPKGKRLYKTLKEQADLYLNRYALARKEVQQIYKDNPKTVTENPYVRRQDHRQARDRAVDAAKKAGWDYEKFAVLEAIRLIDEKGLAEAERITRNTADAAENISNTAGQRYRDILDNAWEDIDAEYQQERERANRILSEAEKKDFAEGGTANMDRATVVAQELLDDAVQIRDVKKDRVEEREDVAALSDKAEDEASRESLYRYMNQLINDPERLTNQILYSDLAPLWYPNVGSFKDVATPLHAEYRTLGDRNYREKVLQVRPPIDIIQYEVYRDENRSKELGQYGIRPTGKFKTANPAVGKFYRTKSEANKQAKSMNDRKEIGQYVEADIKDFRRNRDIEYTATHYSDYPNYIAHMRLGDRYIIDPKLRTIPEIEAALVEANEPELKARREAGALAPESYGPMPSVDKYGPGALSIAVNKKLMTPQEADFYAAYREWGFGRGSDTPKSWGGTGDSHLVDISHVHELQSDRMQAARVIVDPVTREPLEGKDKRGGVPRGFRKSAPSYSVAMELTPNADRTQKEIGGVSLQAFRGDEPYMMREGFGTQKDAQDWLDMFMDRWKQGWYSRSGVPPQGEPEFKLSIKRGKDIIEDRDAPPETPFPESREWGLALIKSAIIEAVRNGQRGLFWSGGETQSRRWRNMAPAHKIQWEQLPVNYGTADSPDIKDTLQVRIYPSSSTYMNLRIDPQTLRIFDQAYAPGAFRMDFIDKSLTDILPKDLVERIVNTATPNAQTYNPKLGSVWYGGTKYKPYYNTILKNEVNSWLKKYKMKLFPLSVPSPNRMDRSRDLSGIPVYRGYKDPKDPTDPTRPDEEAGDFFGMEKAIGEVQKKNIDYIDTDEGYYMEFSPELVDAAKRGQIRTYLPARNIPNETVETGFYSQLQRTLDKKIQGKYANADQIKAMLGEYIVTETLTDADGNKKTAVMQRFPADQKLVAEAFAEEKTRERGGILRAKVRGTESDIKVSWNSPNQIKEDEVIFSNALQRINDLAEAGNGRIAKDMLLRSIRASSPEIFTVGGGDVYQTWTLHGNDGSYFETVFVARGDRQYEGYKPTDKELEDFRGKHYASIPGYLAHVRGKYRIDENGKLGIFIEEFQSDRAQAGRDKGWKIEDPKKMMEEMEFWRLSEIYSEILPKLSKEESQRIRDKVDAAYAKGLTKGGTSREQAELAQQAENKAMVQELAKMLKDASEVPISSLAYNEEMRGKGEEMLGANEQPTVPLGEMVKALTQRRYRDYVRDYGQSGIPDMPFKRDFGLQLFKRILERSVDEDGVPAHIYRTMARRHNALVSKTGRGNLVPVDVEGTPPAGGVPPIEWVGWTKGVTQVKRYEELMRQVIDRIDYANASENAVLDLSNELSGVNPRLSLQVLNQEITPQQYLRNSELADQLEYNDVNIDSVFNKPEDYAVITLTKNEPIMRGDEDDVEVVQPPGAIGTALIEKSTGRLIAGSGRIKKILLDARSKRDEESVILLSDVIGKSMSKKILSDVAPENQTIREKDMTVGGEGMKGYYDIVQPSEIGKYMKPYGERVQDTYLRIGEYAIRGGDTTLRSDGKEFWISSQDNLTPISPKFATAAEAMDFNKRLLEGIVPMWRVDLSEGTRNKIYTEGQRQYLPSRDEPSEPVSMVRFDGTYKDKEGTYLAKIRVVPGPDGNGAFVPDLYFDGGSAKDSKLLTKPAAKTFEQAHAALEQMFKDNDLPMDQFESIEAPVVGTDRQGYKAGAWEKILKANGFEDMIPSLEDQISEQQAREESRTPNLSSSKRLLDDSLNTRWLIKFANGEQAIEYGLNKEAIVSLMKSRYGEQQWIEWVDSIDRLTDDNNPQSERGYMPARFQRPEDLPEDDVLRRKDRFEADALDLVNTPITGIPMVDAGKLDRSFHLTTIARRILDDFEPDIYMRRYRRFIEKLENGEVEGMAPDQAAEMAASLQKNIELNRTAMSYMMDLFSDLAASVPDLSAVDKRTGDLVDPFMVLKANFKGGMKRPIDEILTEMSNVMAAVHPPAGTFPEGYNPGYSPNNDILNAAQVMSDFVDISPETMDTLHMRTMGKTQKQWEKEEAEAYRELLNPEFNDVTEMEGGSFIARKIEPPKDEEGDTDQKFLPRRVVPIPERNFGTPEDQRRTRYKEPNGFFKQFDLSKFELGGKFFDQDTREDLTNRTFESAVIDVTGSSPKMNVDVDTDPSVSEKSEGELYKTNLFRKNAGAGWKWVSENPPEVARIGRGGTEVLVSVERKKRKGEESHIYALKANFENGVELARYPEEKSEPRLRPTGKGTLILGDVVGMIQTKSGKQHPVYSSATISKIPFTKTELDARDAQYAKLREENNVEGAQKLVDEAAKRAQLSERLYRGFRRRPDPANFKTTQMRTTVSLTPVKEIANLYSHDPQMFGISKHKASRVDEFYVDTRDFLDLRDIGTRATLDEILETTGVSWNYYPDEIVEKRYPEGKDNKGRPIFTLNNLIDLLDELHYMGGTNPDIKVSQDNFYLDTLNDVVEKLNNTPWDKKNDPDGEDYVNEIMNIPADIELDVYRVVDSLEFTNAVKGLGYKGIIHRDTVEAGAQYFTQETVAGRPVEEVQGINVEDDYSHDTYRPFQMSQMKLADPFTYDSDENLIPLSQRFNRESPDVRYLPKRKNPPVADFTITKTGKVKLPKKTPKHGFFYGGLIDDTGTEILVKIDPNRVVEPIVKDLSDISGKRVGMVQADRHHTLGKDMGGPMHEFLKSNQETVMGPDGILYKPVWGNLGLGPVNAMRNRLPNVDDGYHIVQIMADDAHRSNIAFGTDYIKEVDAFDKAGKLEPWVKDLAHVLLEIGNLRAQKIKAATRRAAKNRIRAEKGEDPIPAPPNTPEQDAIIAFNKALTPIKNRVAKNDPALLATAKKAALKVYNAHKNKAWFKRLLKLGSNKNFLQEFLGYSFTARGEATKSVSGIPDLPNVVNALQNSEDMINATTGQAVAVIQLSSNPQAFALYFGNNPKQEAAMTPAEKKMRDTLLKNPKFKIHPSYPWVMLGPANGNNFLIKTPTHLRKLFPNYEKQHKKLAANAKKGKPVTDNDVVGSMLKTPLPEIKIP